MEMAQENNDGFLEELINNYKNELSDLVTNHLLDRKNSLNEAGVNFIFKGFFNKISGKEQELLANIMKSEENADMIWKNMPDKIKGVWKRMLIQIKNTKIIENDAKELEEYGFKKM
jgi:hypothetical protein